MQRMRQHHYFQGSKPSHLLAMKIFGSEYCSDILSIRTKQGEITTDPSRINKNFRSYYSDLYRSETTFDMAKYVAFLSEIELPCLPEADSKQLAEPITLEELKGAVLCIPPEVYLSFGNPLDPLLLSMIQHSIEQGSFCRDVNTALVSLLLKKDKDPKAWSSYRPLSLLGANLKIYAIVLAHHLQNYMSLLVAGFIKGCIASENVRHLLYITDASKDNTTSAAVISFLLIGWIGLIYGRHWMRFIIIYIMNPFSAPHQQWS